MTTTPEYTPEQVEAARMRLADNAADFEAFGCTDVPADIRTILSALSRAEAAQAWQPIETAPKDGRYILIAAPSGYTTTPLRVEVCHYDAEYRPLQPWVNHSNDSFTDGGAPPTLWMPLPASPSAAIRARGEAK